MTDTESEQCARNNIFNALAKVNRERRDAFRASLESAVVQVTELLDARKLRGLTRDERVVLEAARGYLKVARPPAELTVAEIMEDKT